MVYSVGTNAIGGEMLSSPEVEEILGVTKATLAKWRMLKKIKCRQYQIGKKMAYGYSAAEVKRVKALMKKKVQPGKGWF